MIDELGGGLGRVHEPPVSVDRADGHGGGHVLTDLLQGGHGIVQSEADQDLGLDQRIADGSHAGEKLLGPAQVHEGGGTSSRVIARIDKSFEVKRAGGVERLRTRSGMLSPC